MHLADLAGAAATLLALAALALAGWAAALLLLREEAERDLLGLAMAALLATTGQGVAVATLLGALGRLRFAEALALQGALAVALALLAARRGAGLLAPLRTGASAGWTIAARHPVLMLVLFHATAVEALRGLLRPPLSWDSLMEHLWLAATWLQRGDLAPPVGPTPFSYYAYIPANGPLWLWWWMAPSHGELYVNLASLPHWLLFGLAAGGLSRQLGAGRLWPLASVLALLLPTAIRFATSQYVDLPMAGALLAAAYFGLRWGREPRPGWALLSGAGLGLAAGAKVLALPYGAALVAALLLAARGSWGRRLPQLLVAAAVAALLGGYFYLRNAVLGVGALALGCLATASGLPSPAAGLPRAHSVLADLERLLADGSLLEAMLGSSEARTLELGIGPPAFVLLPALLVLPWLAARERRREVFVLLALAAAVIAFWLTVPDARSRFVYANVRYALPAIGVAVAAAVALLRRLPIGERWREGLAIAFALQSLLQLHPQMPFAARIVVGLADLAAVALALSPRLRGWARRRWLLLVALAIGLTLLAAPPLAHFRRADRVRAFAQELSVHATTAGLSTGAWGWLERHDARGAVAVAGTLFVYPVMGPDLERRAVHVNVDAADHPHAGAYPRCQPRADPDPLAWERNLDRHRVRWLLVMRVSARLPFPLEDAWAAARPERFVRRFDGGTTRIYERLPASTPGAPPRR